MAAGDRVVGVMVLLNGARVRDAAGFKRRGERPGQYSSRHAFDLLAQGFGAGFNGPLQLVAELNGRDPAAVLAGCERLSAQPLTSSRSPSPRVAASVPSQSYRPIPTLRHRRWPRRTWSTICVTSCCRGSDAHGCDRPGGRVHGRLDRLLPRLRRQAAAVLRDRHPAIRAAAVRHLPVAGDPDPSRPHEPADDRVGTRVTVLVFQHGGWRAFSGFRKARSRHGCR